MKCVAFSPRTAAGVVVRPQLCVAHAHEDAVKGRFLSGPVELLHYVQCRDKNCTTMWQLC